MEQLCYSPLPVTEIERLCRAASSTPQTATVERDGTTMTMQVRSVEKALLRSAQISATFVIEQDESFRLEDNDQGARIRLRIEGPDMASVRFYARLQNSFKASGRNFYVQASPEIAMKYLGEAPPPGEIAWVKF